MGALGHSRHFEAGLCSGQVGWTLEAVMSVLAWVGVPIQHGEGVKTQSCLPHGRECDQSVDSEAACALKACG